jgi:hypothetical protein
MVSPLVSDHEAARRTAAAIAPVTAAPTTAPTVS